MMRFRLIRWGDPSETALDSRAFGGGRMTIGRAANCDWALDDPVRSISKVHCEVFNRGGDVFLTDVSANGVFLNGSAERLPQGESAPLRVGDRLRVGQYELIIDPPDPEPAADPMDGPGLGAPDDGLLEPWDRRAPPRPPAPSAPVPQSQTGARIDDLIDSLGVAPRGPAPTVPAEPFASFNAPRAPPPVSEPAPRGRGDLDAAYTAPILAETAPARSDFAIPETWDLDEDPTPDPPPQPPPAEPAAPVSAPIAEASPPAPTPDPAIAAGDAAFDAFLEGAGLKARAFEGADKAEVMRAAGRVYRQAVLSMGDILRDRAFLKNELRLERTILQMEDNNPLKFQAPQDAAVTLIKPKSPGFLDGPSAVRDGAEDIKKHQIAVLAGMRAALQSLLDRLRPSAILEAAGVKSTGGLGFGGKASKAWAAYAARHEDCEQTGANDPDSALNRAFRRRYEEQMAKLDAL
ncbi:MAG: type VI secretion system-associated FHA domain protein TagH [Maricaulaceae bacterium]